MYVSSQQAHTSTDLTIEERSTSLNSSFDVESSQKVNTHTQPNTSTSPSPSLDDNSPIIIVIPTEDNEMPSSKKNLVSHTFDYIFPSGDSPIFKQNGSYGWVLVMEGFLASVMTDGSLYAFGVFFPSYVNEFNTSYATTSWIGSVASGVTVLFAFHVGYLCDRFGYRVVMSAGAICCGVGYVAASYSQSVWQLILSQGVLFGIGKHRRFILLYFSLFIIALVICLFCIHKVKLTFVFSLFVYS